MVIDLAYVALLLSICVNIAMLTLVVRIYRYLSQSSETVKVAPKRKLGRLRKTERKPEEKKEEEDYGEWWQKGKKRWWQR